MSVKAKLTLAVIGRSVQEPNATGDIRHPWAGLLRRPLGLLILALTLLSIVPIWAFRYFPSQDGPSHVENSHMLSHYFDKDSPYRQYYNINHRPAPNWLSHAVLALLMKALPPLASEKILLTGYVVLFVFSMLYFIRSGPGRGGREWLVLPTLPFIYTYLLHSGFYNSVISFPLVFVTIGYWWRRRDILPGWRQVVGLNLLLTILYFSNILSVIVAMMSVLILAGFHHRAKIWRALVVALAMAPSYVLPLYYLLSSPSEAAGKSGGDRLWAYFAKIGSLTSFDRREDIVGLALALIFAALVLYTLFSEKLGLGRGGASGGTPGSGACRRKDIAGKQAFMVLALALTALYLFSPRRAFGGGAITYRLSLFPFIAILPWLRDHMPRWFRSAVVGAATCVVVVHLAVTAHYYQVLNRGLEEYTSGIGLVERSATILPVGFDHKGEAERIGVYRHAVSYYCVARGAINLANYEGDKDYFPLMYKPGLNPFAAMGQVESQRGNLHPERYPGKIGYVLLWSAPPAFPALEWIEEHADLIHSQGRLSLYRNRESGVR